jgi:NAD(P)-dependent dehydrogenase (short-subunit alcohol dehydrogenase family)
MLDESAVRAAVDEAVRCYGGIDIVLSNAGAAFQSNMAQVHCVAK